MTVQVLPKPVHSPGRKEHTIWGVVTPEIASVYLERNTQNPRRMGPTTIERYKDDMTNGWWITNHQGIAFDVNNLLADGQHRLEAIVRSGVAVYMPVTFDLPANARESMDQQKKRTPAEQLNNFGIKLCGKSVAGIVKCAVLGVERSSRNSLATHVLLKNATRMYEGLKFIDSNLCKNVPKITIAPVMGAVLRAYYSDEAYHHRLAEFCEVMVTGRYNGDADLAAVTLREWLRREGHAQRGDAVDETMKKVERCLLAFLNREQLKAAIEAKRELFPLPWEGQDDDDEVASEAQAPKDRPIDELAKLVGIAS